MATRPLWSTQECSFLSAGVSLLACQHHGNVISTASTDVTALDIHPSRQEKVEALNQLPDLLGAEPGSVAV